MKKYFEWLIQKSKFVVLIAFVCGVLYSLTLLVSITSENIVIELIKDIIGGLSIALSLSLAFTININKNVYSTKQKFVIQGDYVETKNEGANNQEIEKNLAIKHANRAKQDIEKLIDLLEMKNYPRMMGNFIPIAPQRDHIFNQKGFIDVMKKNINELSDSILVIKDVKFGEKLTSCCNYSNQIIDEYNKLLTRASSGLNNNLNQNRIEAIKNMNDILTSYSNELVLLKEIL